MITVESWKQAGRSFIYNGNSIHFRMEGDGQVLLLFHGYPFNSYDWKNIWSELVKEFTVIAPDMLGMGFSDKPDEFEYSFEYHADMFSALVDHLNLRDVHILAHDLGCSVVQELLARSQEGKTTFNILSIVFLNGGLFMDVYKPRPIQKLLALSPPGIGKLVSRLLSKRILYKTISEVFGPETKPDKSLLNSFWEILNYNNGRLISHKISRLVFDKHKYQKRWIGAMQKTRIPMCFINGPFDPNSGREMANRYKEIIPNPNVKLLGDKIGHWPQLEDPHGMLSLFFDFHKINKPISIL